MEKKRFPVENEAFSSNKKIFPGNDIHFPKSTVGKIFCWINCQGFLKKNEIVTEKKCK